MVAKEVLVVGRNSMAATHHWIDQRLIPIPEVGRKPSRRLFQSLGWPLSIWKVERLEASVLLGGVLQPLRFWSAAPAILDMSPHTYMGIVENCLCLCTEKKGDQLDDV